MPSNYSFDRNTQRYRDSRGKFLSEKRVREITVAHIDQLQKDLGAIADLLVANKIGLGAWEEATGKVLARMHSSEYLLGKGGLKQFNDRDRATLEDRIARELTFLRGLSEDLAQQGLSEAQLRARISAYADAGRGTYELARNQSHIENGYRFERRVRTKPESCSPCLQYALMGWQPIGSLPNTGQSCACRSRCGCYKRYAKELPQDFIGRSRFPLHSCSESIQRLGFRDSDWGLPSRLDWY